jgi:glyoxylase-like metal-dependent hydrolase (beta-lactamase superfamily II)
MTGPGTNTYLVGAGTGIAVIDPGPGIPAHLDAIRAFLGPGQQVSHILVTHPHADHSSLAPALAAATGAPVLGFGPAGSGRSPRMQALASAADMGGGEGSDVTFCPDRRLGHGDVVTGDGWQIKALYCPGHMAEHLCLALGDQLFSGDHVMGWSTSLISPPDGDMGAYMASLQMLGQQVWSRFLPGHGHVIGNPAKRLAELVAHRHLREAAILSALTNGSQTLSAVTARVYADTPAALHPAAARNAFAHLVDLADKGHVIATPELTPKAIYRLA